MTRVKLTLDFAIADLADLHEVLTQLRTQGPVHRIIFAGTPIWMVIGHAEVKQVIAVDQYLSAPAAYEEVLGPTMGTVLATMTGRQHRHNRAAIASVFFPKKMRELAETVFTVEAEKLAAQLAGKPEVDLVAEFTRPYTFNNVASILGLPASDAERLQNWAANFMHSFIDLPAAVAAREAMAEYLMPLVAHRRQQPGRDMISLLAHATVDGKRLSDEEVFSFCRNLFSAAIDTSTNGLGSLLAAVLARADLRRFALSGTTGREALVQELLRWEPPLVLIPRKCVKDITLGGERIAAGDAVRLCLTAANNDPMVFSDPRSFDPGRDNSNLAFGQGEHFCVGSHMARRVMETGLQVLLTHYPGIALNADRPPEIVGGVLRGPRTLWAHLGAGKVRTNR